MAKDLASEGEKQFAGSTTNYKDNPDDFYTNGGGFLGTGATEHVNVVKNINPNLSAAAKTQTDTAGMTQDQIAARSMNGVAERGQASLANPGVMNQQAHALGTSGDPGMEAAITNRQNKMYSSDLNNLGHIARMNAVGTQMQQQSAGMQASAAIEQQKQQIINTQMVKFQNDQALRNQILTSVLQTGGAVVGAAAAGPVGGMIASGLGKLASGAAGNTQQQQVPENNGGNF